MRLMDYNVTRADDNLPTSEVVSMGMALVVGCGLVLFAGIGAIIGHTLFDNALGWNKDPIVGGAIGLTVGVVLAFVSVRLIAGSLLRSGN